MPNYKWVLPSVSEDEIEQFHKELTIHPILLRLLLLRGIKDYASAKHFFRPDESQLHNPFLMKDMKKAVERIEEAISKQEKILIYGDYDVDGTTSVSLMYLFLKSIYKNISFYIPNRSREGYGISTQGIDYAAENNFTLVIALDCGIKAVDKINYAHSHQIDFIICDHHLPDDELPSAVAILNPKQKDCLYPYKELSGCGIGFKLAQAISLHRNLDKNTYLQFTDLVAVSIASDIVPITGENRTIAFLGLKKVNSNPLPGLKNLIEISGVAKAAVDITTIVFSIGPRINAAGRMDDATNAVKLLISEDYDASSLKQAKILQTLNAERIDLDKAITQEALEKLKSEADYENKKTTVVHDKSWHKGVIGIVASRLTEHFYRPTIVLTESEEGVYTGSARSIKGFDLYESLYACKEHLIQFGGHRFAAGLTLHKDQINHFRNQFEEVSSKIITADMMIPEIMIDAEISLDDITFSFYNTIIQMAPFGPENMKPVFLTKKIKDTGWAKVLKEMHLKFTFRKENGETIDAIGFGLANKIDLLKSGQVDICYHIDMNEWNGEKKIQLLIKDIRSAVA